MTRKRSIQKNAQNGRSTDLSFLQEFRAPFRVVFPTDKHIYIGLKFRINNLIRIALTLNRSLREKNRIHMDDMGNEKISYKIMIRKIFHPSKVHLSNCR